MSSKQRPSPMQRRLGIEATWISRRHANVVLTLLLVFGLMVLVAALSSCATNSKPLTPQSLEPTPVVTCGEHEPFEPLPAYPRPPAVDSLDTLRAYRTEQLAWAAAAAGVVERNGLKRRATASCLDAYRVRGVIR